MDLTLNIEKIVGTGNDFLFIDENRGLPAELASMPRAKLARRLCDRHVGAGADGLIFITSLAPGRLRWDFYNSDGSRAEMCGNASRCVGRWAERNLSEGAVELETSAGLVRIETGKLAVTSRLEYLDVEFRELAADVGAKRWAATLVNTGVPHAVVEIDDLKKVGSADFRSVILAFRHHPSAGARGANVTFVQALPSLTASAVHKYATVTFERGVEDFTLSCGTGVLAAAAVGLRASGLDATSELAKAVCELHTPGGELTVGFGRGWRGARLTGAADFVYRAEVSLDVMEDEKP